MNNELQIFQQALSQEFQITGIYLCLIFFFFLLLIFLCLKKPVYLHCRAFEHQMNRQVCTKIVQVNVKHKHCRATEQGKEAKLH